MEQFVICPFKAAKRMKGYSINLNEVTLFFPLTFIGNHFQVFSSSKINPKYGNICNSRNDQHQ